MYDKVEEPKENSVSQRKIVRSSIQHNQVGNKSVTPTIQMKQTALNEFKKLTQRIGTEIEGTLGNIFQNISKINQLKPENAEQNICFASAWKGKPDDILLEGDDRVMEENLVQSNFYGVGDALKNKRMANDKGQYMAIDKEVGKESIYEAFQNALFFRAERRDSSASDKGYLKYDCKKHGSKGSASEMPGNKVEEVKKRADGYLFVTKNKEEAKKYSVNAQGGDREVLNIIAARNEVSLMVYDVDSNGYKTTDSLRGIVKEAMTDEAITNINTWLPQNNKVTEKSILDPILKKMLT